MIVPIHVAHFWSKVKIGGSAQCWEWQGATMGRDAAYGKFRDRPAHRFSYEMHKGEIPEGKIVRHLCGNKACVNPDHLEVGTYQENYLDRFILGEGTGGVGGKGEENARAKITEDQARYVLRNPDKLTGAKLARKLGVSPATISLIRSGQRWAHLQDDAA